MRNSPVARTALLAHLTAGLGVALACTSPAPDTRYRLAEGGAHWDTLEGRPIAEELRASYPEFFALVLDPARTDELDLRPLRDDLEADPVGPANYAALHAVAVAYFELNYRAEADRGGPHYFADSFRATTLVAVPWRAYSEIQDAELRNAILDFFEDAGSGEKLGTDSTAPRLARVVASLVPKEDDPLRRARIEDLARRIGGLADPRDPGASTP